MDTYLECIPCFFKQALYASRAASKDEMITRQVLDRVAGLIPGIPLENPPPETARLIYSVVREVTGVKDPFREYKEKSIDNALSIFDKLKSVIRSSEDPLRMAVKIAIAGNVVDPGANPDFDLEREMNEVLERELSIDHSESFRRSIERAETILYLGDNAGETVFDRLLIETIGKETVYAVRDAPVINDATIEDAWQSGIGKIAKVISSGCDAPGTILKRCSSEFLEIFKKAKVIVSKGQGNLESLSGENGPIFFLLKVKCPVIARHLGTEIGSMILKKGSLKDD
jgi:uncharacterized protein with ATP-grasp and redox domains